MKNRLTHDYYRVSLFFIHHSSLPCERLPEPGGCEILGLPRFGND